MKVTDIPLLLSAVAESYSTSSRELEDGVTTPSAAAQLAAMVETVLGIHQHRLWRRNPDNPSGWLTTDDVAVAELAECRACGEIDAELFWCKHLRQMFASYCELDLKLADSPADWPDLVEAIRAARSAYEGPIASAVIRSIVNPAHSPASRIELANAVLASTPKAVGGS